MNPELEKEFEKIAEQAIAAAEKIQCPFSEFVEGLKIIEEDVKFRRQKAEEELDAQHDRDIGANHGEVSSDDTD